MTELVIWRHPAPPDARGICLGRSDMPVDRRRAKRLAHRVRAWARRYAAARVIYTSPLRRSAAVGRCLSRWGWVHRIDPRLAELDFGAWTGQRWDEIGTAAVDAWCSDFARHAPGGGESVAALLERVAAFVATHHDAPPCLVIGHAGWISAAIWLARSRGDLPTAAQWPAAAAYAARVELPGAPLALNQSQ